MVPKMSKNGRKLPRSILFMAVLNGIQGDGFIADTYKRELKKGKCKMSAIGVCMNKLARIVFGVLKNDMPFDPEIIRCHQHRSQPKASVKAKSNKRRFQQEDRNAPISRRQTKKRKEREQSQSEHVTISEIESSPLAVS